MLRPGSVALVGVSGRPGSLGARPWRFLRDQGFAGEVHLVNPAYDEIEGVRCHPSLTDVGAPVDLVLSMVPAAATLEVVREAGAVGAAGVIVFASGFGETGDAGLALQHELVATARAHGVRLLGPNCQGLVHAPSGLFATFTAAADRPRARTSGVAYVGQSGAVGGSVLDLATEMGLGLSVWASTGNQADLQLVEVASAVVEDPSVRVVMMYTETVPDGRDFHTLATRAATLGKRLVVLVSGRSEAGRRAAASHTGAMLGDDVPLVLAAAQHGVTLVADVDEMLAVAAVLDRTAPPRGRRVAVITTSGGAGSLAADHCAAQDLTLPVLSPATQARLTPLVPDFGAVANPVDVTAQLFNREGSSHALGAVCEIVAADPEVDAVAVVLTMVTGRQADDVARDLVATAEGLEVPLLVAWLASPSQTREARARFADAGVPVLTSVGALARTTALLAGAVARPRTPGPGAAGVRDIPDGSAALADVLAGGPGEKLLRALGIAAPTSRLVTSAAEAAEAVHDLGRPAALKLVATGLLHKSDLGGVRLDVTADEAADVHDALLKVASEAGLQVQGVDVQAMVTPGVELLVGVTSGTDGYPPVVTVGVGGVRTELYGDVVPALAPVTEDEATDLLRRLRGWPLLAGFRGSAPADVEAAARAVAAVSRAAAGLEGRAFELEINPLVVAPAGGGAHAVDLLASAGPTPPTPQTSRDAGRQEQ